MLEADSVLRGGSNGAIVSEWMGGRELGAGARGGLEGRAPRPGGSEPPALLGRAEPRGATAGRELREGGASDG